MAIATATATVGDDIVDSIDTTLLRGLEPVLSVAEQRYITTLLTSGNPNDVAAAAKMLYEVGFAIYHADPSESIRRSFATSTEIFTTHHFDEHHTKKNYYTHRRPAYNDYENRVAQEKKEAVYQQERTATALPLPVRMPRYVKKKATWIISLDLLLLVLLLFAPLSLTGSNELLSCFSFPIWLLFCRYVVLEPFDPVEDHPTNKPLLTFIEDEVTGTLGEAFTKFHIRRDTKKEIKNLLPKIGGLFQKTTKKKDAKDDNDDQQQQQQQHHHHHSHVYTVEKSLLQTEGIAAIVNRMDEGYNTKLSEQHPQEPRVLVSHVSHHAGKLGTVHKGDVITHVNGQEFSGGTVVELQRIIAEQYHRYSQTTNDNDKTQIRLELVVNAEQCIAQALKLRSI